MIEKALELAEKGFRVFPVAYNTKDKPLIKAWQTQATCDLEQVKEWWTTWPDANIGIVPGPKSFVFDFDNKPGVQESINKLRKLGLPATAMVKTPNGYHLYFQHPGGIIKAIDAEWSKQFPGIDIRADNAYIIAPGSTVNGKGYQSIHPIDELYGALPFHPSSLASLPFSIVELLPFKEKPGEAHQPLIDPDAVPPGGFVLPDVISIGTRDTTMYQYVCSLIGKHKTKDEIVILAQQAYGRCEQSPSDPFPWHVVESIINRAYNDYAAPPLQEITQSPPKPLTLLQDALERYVLIEDCNMVADLKSHRKQALLKLENWKNSKKNVWIDTAEKSKPLPLVWLVHANRRTAYSLRYYPSDSRLFQQYGQLYYNTYIPPDIKPVPGKDYNVVLEHLHYLFEGDKESITYFLYWMAFTVRYPEIRIPWAPIIISSCQGVGKGWLFHLMVKLLGEENCKRIDPQDLTEQKITFNEWWGGTLLCLDEVDPKYNFIEKLKPIITETSGIINEKYGRKIQRDIFCNVIAFSNHFNALKLDINDRRWWVIYSRVSLKPPEYYVYLYAWLKTTGPAQFLHFLHSLDLSKFQYAAPPPMTKSKRDMIETCKTEIEACLEDAIDLKLGPFAYDIISTEIATIYVANKIKHPLSWHEQIQIGHILRQHSPASLPNHGGQYMIKGQRRVRLILIRNPEKWLAVDSTEIVEEFLKAEKAALL